MVDGAGPEPTAEGFLPRVAVNALPQPRPAPPGWFWTQSGFHGNALHDTTLVGRYGCSGYWG